ncbi:MAG: NifB/NifX family molybdenum-iron cluster-binding protein, partial [Anaerolineales bacterium]|nr:NifB/NifX family molybdenum-iron cluster-binding protein [Anaerolineales bacterium]
MIIAVSSESDQGLESVVSAHFGRCPFFILADVEGEEIKSVRSLQNPFFGHHQPGQVPGFIHEQGANVMLTGGMGQRAIQFFQQYGIQAATGAHGTVRHSLQMFFQAELREA